MRAIQILVDGFAISSLYGLAAVGFTLMFGVSGVLNLAHGGIMVVAAIVGWAAAGEFGLGTYAGTLVGVLAGLITAYATYFDRGAADPAFPRHPAGRDRDLRAHRHAALGHHDPGRHGLPVQRQPGDHAAADRRRGRHFRRAHADQQDPDRGHRLGGHRAAVAAGQPHPHRQGAARRLDQSARPDAARLSSSPSFI